MNKLIAKNTLYLYFRMLISMGVGLYTSRVVLATLGVEDYGVYNVVGGMVFMLSFLNVSMSGATSRFLTFALGKNDKAEFQKMFSAALTIHILIAFIILVLAETAGLWFFENKIVIAPDRMNAARIVYQLSIISTMATIIQAPYNAAIIAYEQMNVYAYIEILSVCLKLSIVFLLIVAHWDKLILYAFLMLLVSFLIAITYGIFCVKRFKNCRYQYEWNKNVIYPMLTFTGWSAFGCVAHMGTTQGINILLNLFFGTVINAAYGIAAQVNGAITSFVSNFQTAVNPQIVKLYAAGKMNDLYNLMFENAKFSFSLMWLLLLPLSLRLETVLHVWLVEVPEHAVLFCRLALVQSLIVCVQRPFVMAILATGKIRLFQMSVGTVLLSVLPISYFFLKAGMTPHTVFLICIGASVVELLLELYLLKKWINLSLVALSKTILIPIFLIITCTLPTAIWVNHYCSFILTTLISGLSICIAAYFIVFTTETRTKAIHYIKYKVAQRF